MTKLLLAQIFKIKLFSICECWLSLLEFCSVVHSKYHDMPELSFYLNQCTNSWLIKFLCCKFNLTSRRNFLSERISKKERKYSSSEHVWHQEKSKDPSTLHYVYLRHHIHTLFLCVYYLLLLYFRAQL